MEVTAPSTLPCTQYRLEAMAAGESHGGGGKCSPADHWQEAPAGGGPSQNLTCPLPTPPTRLSGQSQTQCIFPQKRSAGLILARDTETQDQDQGKVLWRADVSQAPCFSVRPQTGHLRASISISEEQGARQVCGPLSAILVPRAQEPLTQFGEFWKRRTWTRS